MRSSGNSFRHGLRASQCVTAVETSAEYRELRTALFAEWQPRSFSEELEVDRLARSYWYRNRAEVAMNEALNSEIYSAIEVKLDQQLKATAPELERRHDPAEENTDGRRGRRARRMRRRHDRMLEFQAEVKTHLRKNAVGVGAALCRLGAQGDKKLSTLMRYLNQWEREVERTTQTLRKLRGKNDG
jgi:hypothetical protein